MDTRKKIISLRDAAEVAARERIRGKRVVVDVGYYDPVTAEHARRLEALRQNECVLLAVVVDPPEPLLETRARAELVAALRAVDYVVAAGSEPPGDFLTLLEGAAVNRSEQTDLELRQRLIEHVQARHRTT